MTEKSTTLVHHVHRSSLIGGLTGMIVGTILQPLEILKTNMILNPTRKLQIESHSMIKSLYFCSKEIYKSEGILGFWRGLTPALLKMVSSSSIYFACLSVLDEKMSNYLQYNSDSINFVSSSMARITSGFLTNPLAVVRTRFEVMGFKEYNSLFDAFRKIYILEGLKGFWTGVFATAARDAPFAGIYFTLYVRVKRIMETNFNQNSLLINSFIAGITAGFTATLLTNPFDIIRARIQYRFYTNKKEHRYYTGLIDGFKKIYKHEGLKGFMKGLGPRLLRKPLSNASTFVVFEGMHRIINKEEAF